MEGHSRNGLRKESSAREHLLPFVMDGRHDHGHDPAMVGQLEYLPVFHPCEVLPGMVSQLPY